MIAVDTNVIVYAHRSDSPHHVAALKALTRLSEGAAPWGLPVFCIGEFLRVVTHRRIFEQPSTPKEATSVMERLLESPRIVVLSPGERFPALYLRCAGDNDARGNLAFDAQIAAVCEEHGCRHLLTLDRDFSRFPRLHIVNLDDA